jgi:hypothetical protein
MNNVREKTPMIVWAFHPHIGLPIFRFTNNSLIHQADESDFNRVQEGIDFATKHWSRDAYVGLEVALINDSSHQGRSVHSTSEVTKLKYLQLNPIIFGNKAEDKWLFYTVNQLERTALRDQFNATLFGETRLIRTFPSSRLKRHFANNADD